MMAVLMEPRQIIVQEDLFATLPLAEPTQGHIRGEAVEPRGEGRFASKRFDLLMDRQEHFLDDLFRLRLIPNEFERLSVYPRDVLTEDRLKGPVVSSLHPLDKHPLFVGGSLASCR